MHSFSHAHCLAAGRGRRSCLALYGSASGSGLRSPYASSPTHQAVSCSTLLYLWTGSSSPVASHPAFRRRSFLRLRTASVLSDGDFHPTVGAHSQAHVGTRSRAIRRCTSRRFLLLLLRTRSCAIGAEVLISLAKWSPFSDVRCRIAQERVPTNLRCGAGSHGSAFYEC